METPLAQVLLQHGQFVRALALHLLRDPSLADDAEQDTWLRYLERAPAERGQLRGWLRRVLNNWSASRQRGARAAAVLDEREPARGEPSPVEHAERAELLTRLVAAVVALDEPYHSTILERYFRGRDAHTLAKETGTPLATVRSRERRALEKLRERLDRECGERSTWAVALAALLRDPPAVARPAFPTSRVLQAGLALSIVAGGVFLWRVVVRSRGSESSTPELAEQESKTADAAGVATVRLARAGTSGDQAPLPVGYSARREVSGAQSLARGSAALQAGTCEIRGRFLSPGGSPASGVSLFVESYEGRDGLESDTPPGFDEPESWESTTDADGRFSFVFVPPPSCAFLLASKSDHADESWSWDQLLPGEVQDLGEVELRPGGALEGRLLDVRGAPVLVDGWDVFVEDSRSRTPNGRNGFSTEESVDPTTARYQLEGVPAGPVHVRAARRGSSSGPESSVTIVAGQTAVLDLTYEGPDLMRRIALIPTTPCFFPVDPSRSSIHLSGSGIEARTAEQDDPGSLFVFDDLAPGEYTLQIDDPRFFPWSESGVTPGSILWPELEGNSGLVLDVRDEHGEPLPLHAVDATLRQLDTGPVPYSSPWRLRLHDGREPLVGGRVGRMIAGDYTIAVSVDGLGTRALDVEGLLPGETRALAFVFGPPILLTGRVLRPDGTPVAGCPVALLVPAAEGDSPSSSILLEGPNYEGAFKPWMATYRRERARTNSDVDGSFRFELPAPDSCALCAYPKGNPTLVTATASVRVEAGEPHVLDVVLPFTGRIRGQVRVPTEPIVAGLRVWAGNDDADIVFGPLETEAVELARDGSYELGDLAPGAAHVYLVLPRPAVGLWTIGGQILSGGLSLGAVDVVAGETARADFDGASSWPGTASVRVIVDGAPAQGIRVSLADADAESDADGRASLAAFPGSWEVFVESPTQSWGLRSPTAVLVRSNQDVSVTIHVELVRGKVTCVDSQGAPLVHQRLLLSLDARGEHGLTWLETDGAGQLELTLPASDYGLTREGDEQPHPLSWTATGPLAPTVEF